MNTLVEPVVNLYQAQLQATKDVGGLLLAGIEQIDRIALQAARDTLREQLQKIQSPATTEDFGTAAWRDALTQPNIDRATNLAREVLNALTNTFAGITAVTKAYMQELDRGAVVMVGDIQREAKEAAAAGASGNASEYWNTAWQQAWEQMNAMSEQYVRATQQVATGDKAAAVPPAKTAAAPETRSSPRAM